MGELLKLEPIKEASHSPPSIKNATKPTTSVTDPHTRNTSSSSQEHSESASQKTDEATQKKENVTCTLEARETFKSPTGVLAGDLGRNLLIKSPSLPTPKLMALPKHMQVAQLGSKAVRSKGNSLLTSTAMRFQSVNDGLNSILDGSPDPIPGKLALKLCSACTMSLLALPLIKNVFCAPYKFVLTRKLESGLQYGLLLYLNLFT